MTRTSAQDVQEELLTNIRKGQQAIVYAIRTWAETVRAVTPKLPGVSVPFGDKLPSPQEAVDSAYQLAEQLLVNQRKFAEDVLKVTAPLMPGNSNGNSVTAPWIAKSELKAAPVTPAPRATFVAPAPQALVAKVEPKPTAVVPVPKAPVARVESKLVAAPSVPSVPSVPAAPVAKSEPVTPAPQAAAPKAATPPKTATPKTATPKTAAPKAATPKTATPKAAAPKAAAPKAAAPKAAAPKAASAKITPKATSAASAPRTTAAKSAPRTTAKRATPKAADAN